MLIRVQLVQSTDMVHLLSSTKMGSFKKYLFRVFYVTLFFGGIFFSKDTVTQFLAAKTSFRAITSNIETKDLPVIFLCYERAVDPKIQVRLLSNTKYFSVTQTVMDVHTVAIK